MVSLQVVGTKLCFGMPPIAIKKLLKNHAKSWENIQKNSLKLILTFNKVYINLSKGKHNELHITQ
jgi:membrane-anchored glycerophosphoryl diester phosphodiesterase (GDPDase)